MQENKSIKNSNAQPPHGWPPASRLVPGASPVSLSLLPMRFPRFSEGKIDSGSYNEAVETRRMCPNCRAFITIKDRVCPYCGVQLGPRAVDMRASQVAASLLPTANLTSLIVLVINV